MDMENLNSKKNSYLKILHNINYWLNPFYMIAHELGIDKKDGVVFNKWIDKFFISIIKWMSKQISRFNKTF